MTSHLAVVPVTHLDAQTDRALRYASTLSARVVALHIAADGAPGFAERWAARGSTVPLVVLHSPHRRLPRAIDVLRRSQRADRVTLVLPEGSTPGVLGSGVVVRAVPGGFGQE